MPLVQPPEQIPPLIAAASLERRDGGLCFLASIVLSELAARGIPESEEGRRVDVDEKTISYKYYKGKEHSAPNASILLSKDEQEAMN